MLCARTPEWEFPPAGAGSPPACPGCPDCPLSEPGPDWLGGSVVPAEPDAPTAAVEGAAALQVLAARAARSSSAVGAEAETTTSVIRRTSRPDAVRAEIR